jgi:hypothetical protein
LPGATVFSNQISTDTASSSGITPAATAATGHDDSLVYVGTRANIAGSPTRALVTSRSSGPATTVISAWGLGINNTLTTHKHPEPSWGIDELAGYPTAHAASAPSRAADFK